MKQGIEFIIAIVSGALGAAGVILAARKAKGGLRDPLVAGAALTAAGLLLCDVVWVMRL